MKKQRQARALRIGLGIVLLVTFVTLMAFLRHFPSEAYPGMPQEYRAYWTWVSSISEDSTFALDAGLDLLTEHPQFGPLYLRIVNLCVEQEATERCKSIFNEISPPTASASLYRDAARALLSVPEDPIRAQNTFRAIAASSALDPPLARLVVDELRRERADSILGIIESEWDQRLQQDSMQAGAAFGLGYASVLRSEWDRPEKLFQHVTKVLPGDPGAYRELGRIYYVTGRSDAFQQALTRGIEVAISSYDLEQELILRGNLGLGLFQQGDLQGAERLFSEALMQSRRLSDRETEGFNQYRLASVRLKQYRYDEALALLDSAEVNYARFVPRQLPEVFALRGMALQGLYRMSDAERVLEEAIFIAEKQKNIGVKIQASVVLAQLRSRMGRYTAALETGVEALQLARKYRQVDAEIAAGLALGGIERLQGNYEAAQAHYTSALELAIKTKNSSRERELYARLGTIALNVRDINSAYTHFEAMLDNVRENGEPVAVAQAYLRLGHTFARFKNREEAVRLYNLGLQELGPLKQAQQASSDQLLRATLLIVKAWNLVNLGEFTQARSLLQDGRRLSRNHAPHLYRIEVVLGNLFLKQGQYREAIHHFQTALSMREGARRPSIDWHVLHAKAFAHWRLGENREAERFFRESIALIETLRENLDQSRNRSFFVQDKIQVYKDFGAFLYENGRVEESFHFLERAKSRSLVDLLYTSQQERRADSLQITDQAIEMYRRIRALEEAMDPETDALDSDIEPASDENQVRYLRRERRWADSVYKQAELDLAASKPMYTFRPLVIDSVRHVLTNREALVVFNLRQSQEDAEHNPSLVHIVLTDSVIVRELDTDQHAVGESIRFFRDQIGTTGLGNAWVPIARRLYSELMGEVVRALPERIQHLHIIPEGILHYLPFAALQSPSGRFLIESYTLSVSPSASTLKLCRERNPKRWRSMILLADPEESLPGSRQEVLDIASRSPRRRLALTGTEATYSNLRELAGQYDILHFATHGTFESRKPWRSSLVLYDRNLTAADIAQLNLDAYLVTLSACETALSAGDASDVPTGDEWVGLNQAFLAAGTPSVMASLWPIDDKVSSTFMIKFYESLGHAGKSHALSEVQRQFIHNPETKHPFFWAPFMIIGDPL